MLVGSPVSAQTYGPGGIGPRYETQYNGPGWNTALGRSADAYARSPGASRSSRRPSGSYDSRSDLIGSNPVLPGRW